MKSSHKLFSAITGILYVLIAILIAVNPVDYLVSISWLISLGLLVSAISSLIGYFTMPRELRHSIYLLDAIINLIFAFYLFTRGFAVLPFVVPTIIGIWLIFQAVVLFIKGRRISFVLPFFGSNVTWAAVLALLLGLVLVFNPLGTSVFLMYVIAFSFLTSGISNLIDIFRD